MLKEYNEIRWLHISDLHIGNPDSLWLDPTLRDRLKGLLRTIGSIDFVLITGDVIHQGKYQDRDMVQQAEKLISEIKEFCGHIIFCIGNHDYVRDDARFTLLKDWEQKSLDKKIKQQENYASKLRPDFEKFEKFCKISCFYTKNMIKCLWLVNNVHSLLKMFINQIWVHIVPNREKVLYLLFFFFCEK